MSGVFVWVKNENLVDPKNFPCVSPLPNLLPPRRTTRRNATVEEGVPTTAAVEDEAVGGKDLSPVKRKSRRAAAAETTTSMAARGRGRGCGLNLQSRKIWHSRIVAKLKSV